MKLNDKWNNVNAKSTVRTSNVLNEGEKKSKSSFKNVLRKNVQALKNMITDF